MSGKQIQHIYHRTAGGYALYDHTEVIDVAHQEDKTDIVHLLIELPTRDEVLDILTDKPKITLEGAHNELFNGVLPDWLFLA